MYICAQHVCRSQAGLGTGIRYTVWALGTKPGSSGRAHTLGYLQTLHPPVLSKVTWSGQAEVEHRRARLVVREPTPVLPSNCIPVCCENRHCGKNRSTAHSAVRSDHSYLNAVGSSRDFRRRDLNLFRKTFMFRPLESRSAHLSARCLLGLVVFPEFHHHEGRRERLPK